MPAIRVIVVVVVVAPSIVVAGVVVPFRMDRPPLSRLSLDRGLPRPGPGASSRYRVANKKRKDGKRRRFVKREPSVSRIVTVFN